MTERFVKYAVPSPGHHQQDFFDDPSESHEAVRGLALRVTASGAKSWCLFYRVHGRRVRYTLGTYPAHSLAQAREQAGKLRQAVERGEDPRRQREQAHREPTFAHAAQEYVERYARVRKRGWKTDAYLIKRDLLPAWQTWRLREINRRDVRDLLDRMVERGAPQSARRTFALIHTMFNWFVSREMLAGSPCVGISSPAPATSRDRVLSLDELRRVWLAIEEETEPSRSIFALVLLTAQRGGEVRSMQRADVDLESPWWTIPAERSKNGLPHRVPLVPKAAGIIRDRLAAHTSCWVFPANSHVGRVTSLGRPLDRIQRRSETTNWAPHDLRRSVASHMTGMGIPRLVVAKILNHTEAGVTKVYDRHSYDPEKHQALDAWARKLESIVSGEPLPKVVPLRSA